LVTSDDDAAFPESLFGRNLRRLRLAKGLTQVQLAQRLAHTNNSQVAKWENGHAAPRKTTLRRLAQVLEVGVPDLLRQEPFLPRAPENIDTVKSVVEALLDLRSTDPSAAPAVAKSTNDAVTRKTERICHLVRGLCSLEALTVVERVVIEELSKQTQAPAGDTATPLPRDRRPTPRR
jgi:transcriptional regulator with XRE-family HTH domain